MSSITRRPRQLLGALLFGVLATVIVTWSLALLVDLRERGQYSGANVDIDVDGEGQWFTETLRGPGGVFVYSWRQSSVREWERIHAAQSATSNTPRIGGVERPTERFRATGEETRWLDAWGWPMHALWCE